MGIEAARRGAEQWLGLRRCGREVRKLAEKSAQSTKEISELIPEHSKEARKSGREYGRAPTLVNEGLELGGEFNGAPAHRFRVVTEVYKVRQEMARPPTSNPTVRHRFARAYHQPERNHPRDQLAVERQASGAQAVVKAMERMRELVQQSNSVRPELAASSDRCRRMSRGLLEFMDRFALEIIGTGTNREEQARNARRAAAERTSNRVIPRTS